jgi:hypothetical protein
MHRLFFLRLFLVYSSSSLNFLSSIAALMLGAEYTGRKLAGVHRRAFIWPAAAVGEATHQRLSYAAVVG